LFTLGASSRAVDWFRTERVNRVAACIASQCVRTRRVLRISDTA
jgi:hypothetical protein